MPPGGGEIPPARSPDVRKILLREPQRIERQHRAGQRAARLQRERVLAEIEEDDAEERLPCRARDVEVETRVPRARCDPRLREERELLSDDVTGFVGELRV